MPDEHRFTIGRGRQCDIVLADDSVSRVHADLTFLMNGKLLLTDRRSTHGTSVVQRDGKDISVRQELVSPTDVIQFGDVRMTVKEILESVQLKFPDLRGRNIDPPGPDPEPSEPWVRGSQLQRCKKCGAIKQTAGPCKVCNP